MVVHASRIKRLNQKAAVQGEFVLYWMQQSQRAEENHALEYAVHEANRLGQMLVVLFVLTADYPDANLRHYTFMLEGLKETKQTLASRNIRMILRVGPPVETVLDIGKNATMVICDRGYLRHQRQWRQDTARKSACRVIQVEADVIVPIEEVSDKAEYAAYTIRKKIDRLMEDYLVPVAYGKVDHPSLDINLSETGLENIPGLLKDLKIDDRIQPVGQFFRGGTTEAKQRFDDFIDSRLAGYADHRSAPETEYASGMSPYLHFGQISPLYMALKISRFKAQFPESVSSFLEELIIRRELAANFVYYHPAYDSLACLPDWAKKTLADHEKDPREQLYTRSQLVACATHDEYWNAAMREMIITGYMHNYMRMYWGKKVLEWSPTPRAAYDMLIDLNNTYFLDGRDPGSYAGVGWIFGLHDRAWFERSIFGKVRYMAASGLERKCDINGYVTRVNTMAEKGYKNDT